MHIDSYTTCSGSGLHPSSNHNLLITCIPLPPTEGATLPGVGVMLESDNTGKIIHLEMSSYPEGKYKCMSDITVNCL